MADKSNRRGDVDEVFDGEDGEEFTEDFDDDTDDVDDDAPAAGREKRSTAVKARTSTKSGQAKAVARKKDKEKGPGLFARFLRFVREIVAELAKVIWPTRKELVTYTSVVVVFVTIVLTVVGLLDYGFAWLVGLVFGHKA